MDETQELKGKKSGKWIILAIVLVALIAIGIVCFITLGNTPEKRFRKQMDMGNKYLEEMEYEKAVAAFEAAIDIDPNNADAYIGLAKAYLGLGDLEKARKAFKKAIKLNPDYAEEYADLAKALGLDEKAEADKKEKDEEETTDTTETEESGEPSGEDEELQEKQLDGMVSMDDVPGFHEYVHEYANGGILFVSKDGKYGALDYQGNVILPCEYDMYYNASDTGYFAMRKENMTTIFSPKGEAIETLEYADVATSNGVYVTEKSWVITYKKYDGTVLYQGNSWSYTAFCEGKAIISDSNGGYLLVTESGTSKIDDAWFYEYFESEISGGNLISSSAGMDYPKFILSSWDGKLVGGVGTKKAIIDENGNLCCKVAGEEDRSEYGVPSNGKFLIGLAEKNDTGDWRMESISYRWYAKEGGQAMNYGSKMVLLNRGKEVLVDFEKLDQVANSLVCDYIGICDEKYWLVNKDGNWGYCDHDGNIVKYYDDAAKFVNGRAFVVEDGTVYMIDESFNILAEVGKGTGVYSSGDLFSIIDQDNVTHYYMCTGGDLVKR